MKNSLYNFLLKIFFLRSDLSNYVKFKIFDIQIGKNSKVNGSLFLKGRGSIRIGDNVVINSNYFLNPIGGQSFTSIVTEKNATLNIENNVGISNSAIYCSKKITIKKDVLIGGDCKIYDTDFHSIYLTDRKSVPERKTKTAPVIINQGVFIGTGSIILKGVEIGENSVIAAGSVLSKSVPQNQVWGGNPAKFIKNI